MLKYVNTGVVFQEIPDEVTLSINISNCPCRCPGCHSKYLWADIGTPLTSVEINSVIDKCNQDITCVCLMGGDADPSYINTLAEYIHTTHPKLKVGWYSGKTIIPSVINKSNFDYIKIGPYIRHLGALKSKTTNQKLYKKGTNGKFTDITSRFWKK